ncbi:MAG: histidine kinase, partial [Calditrichaeota bacterium]
MSSTPKRWIKRIQKSHFQVKHLLVIFFILIFFLILILFVQKTSVQELLVNTQNWYQQDSAERMANLTATTLELLIEQNTESRFITPRDKARMIKALDILLSQ